MRGQSSIEYLVIIGIVIITIALTAGLAWQENEISTRINQANIAVKKIAASAENIYAQGPGSKSVISVIVPVGYSSSKSSINENQILFVINTPGGEMTVFAITKANVTGSLPTGPGFRNIELKTIEGYVNITSS
jgi:uncharacterized protein (UPF0333 family)